MTRISTLGLLIALTALLTPSSGAGRRHPTAGGDVTVALPGSLQAATRDALQFVALTEPDDPSLPALARAAWPLLPGTRVRSRVIRSLRSDDAARRWVVEPHAAVPGLTESLRSCLAAPPGGPWPGRALAAADVQATVSEASGSIAVVLSRGVSVLPELLTGCLMRPEGPTGAFVEGRQGRYDSRDDAPGGRPLIDGVWLRSPDGPADLSFGDAEPDGGSLLVAPWPDVLLLVLDAPARAADPLALGADPAGLSRFQQDLAPDLLLAVRHGGRGAAARSVLPPGVGPDRPLPGAREPVDPRPIARRLLSPDAPRLNVVVPAGDPLVADVADRLALLLNDRGWRADADAPTAPTARIIRWRPPVSDPGLALLVLADRIPELLLDPDHAALLLAGDPSSRVSAAATLERRWLEAGHVVPLLTASRWLVAHPALRGVRIRGDGVPLLDDASWSTP